MKKMISIVIPVYNEEPNIELCYDALNEFLITLNDRYNFEFVFTDNCSTDRTFELLKALCLKDSRVRAFRFSRNFGYQKSILMGYLKAKGDAAIQFDCDLQDPPSMLPVFIDNWERGYKVVYGIRKGRQEGFFITSLRKAFYRFIDSVSSTKLPHDAGDFRLVDRRILQELGKIEDADPYLRGAIAELGFSHIGIEYERASRKFGESKFNFSALLRLAIDGITNHSVVPLRFATYVGLATSFLTFIALVAYVIGKLIFQTEWPEGFATTTALILISLSLNALFLGIIGEYLGRIFVQLKKVPLPIVEVSLNDSQDSNE